MSENLFLLLQSFGRKAAELFKGSHQALSEAKKRLLFLSLPAPLLTSQTDLLRDETNVLQIHVHPWLSGNLFLVQNDCLKCEGESNRDPGVDVGQRWGRGGVVCSHGACTFAPAACPSGIQGADRYNETGPIDLPSIGECHCIFSSPCLFCHWATFKHSQIDLKTSLLNSFISYIAFHDLSPHS